MDPPYSEIVRWRLLYVPNNGRLAIVNFTFPSLIGRYYLDVSAIPTSHRAGKG